MKLEVPDLDHINQENSVYLDKSSKYLSSLHSFLDTHSVTTLELDTSHFTDLKAKLDTLT